MDSNKLKTLHVALDNIHGKMAEYDALCVSLDWRKGFEESAKQRCMRCLSEVESCLLEVLTPLEQIKKYIVDARTSLEEVGVTEALRAAEGGTDGEDAAWMRPPADLQTLLSRMCVLYT